MAAFLNVCRFTPTAGGTTDWTYSSAVTGYQSPALAGVVNSRVYKYRAESTDLLQWEIGEGAYNTGTGVLARTTVLYNSSGTGTATGQSGAGSKISFSAAPTVAIVAVKEDLLAIEEANSFTAAQKAQAQSNLGLREVLTANRTYYVRTDGSDSNNGLADSAGGAFLTIQKAIDVCSSLDIGIYNVDVDIGNGTYGAGCTVVGPWHGSGTVSITGDTTTPSNVIIAATAGSAINVKNGGRLTIGGLKLTNSAAGYLLNAELKGFITASGQMDYGSVAAGGQQIRVVTGGSLTITANYTISAGVTGGYHWFISSHGVLICQSRTITLTGTPAFGIFAFTGYDGISFINGNTFSGSATGTRYLVDTNGIVNTAGGGATYLPGNVAGSTATQGQYL